MLPISVRAGRVFLEIATKTQSHSDVAQRTQLLRAAMGVHSPAFHSAPSKNRPPSQSGWHTVDGCRIAWEAFPSEIETAPPLVCLHAAGSGSREFRPLLERRPPGSRLILIDWPGHGRSDDLAKDSHGSSLSLTVENCARIVEKLMQHLGVQKPILVGSGFGAAVAIRFAADHPDAVLGLVLCLPAGLVSASGTDPYLQPGKRGLKRLLRQMQKSASGKIRPTAAAAARRQALRLEVLRPAMLPIRTAARLSLENSAASLRKAVESLSCPVFFALSHDSQEYPVRKYIALLDPSLAWAPQHQFTVFYGAFHPIWDEPDRFTLALSSFIEARLPVARHNHAWLLSEVDWPTRNNNLWKCVHPDCIAERILPTGRDANKAAS